MEVASECKHLTRGSGNITYRTAERHDNDDGGHDAGSDVRIGSAVKDLDVRLSGSTFAGDFEIADAETECHDHDEARGSMEEECPYL